MTLLALTAVIAGAILLIVVALNTLITNDGEAKTIPRRDIPNGRSKHRFEVVSPELDAANNDGSKSGHESSMNGLAHRIGEGLVDVSPQQARESLAEQTWLGAFFKVLNERSRDRHTCELMTSAHGVNMTAAKQATELLSEAVTFGRKAHEFSLLDEEKEVKRTGLQAESAENLARIAEANARAKAAENPPVPPPPHHEPKKEDARTPAEKLVEQVLADLDKRGPLVRSAARQQIETKAREMFKGDPNGFAAYMEAVDRKLAENARP